MKIQRYYLPISCFKSRGPVKGRGCAISGPAALPAKRSVSTAEIDREVAVSAALNDDRLPAAVLSFNAELKRGH